MKLKLLFSVLTLLVISTTGLLMYDFKQFAANPANPADQTDRSFLVHPGEPFGKITAKLFDDGLITSSLKFKLLARFNKLDTTIKAGEYRLSASMTPEIILKTLNSGKVYLYKITIPEGYNLRQIAELFGQTGLVGEKDFFKAATDAPLAQKMGIDAQTFEGYLFPETYFFPRGVTPEQIIGTMVEHFRSVFIPEWIERTRKMNFTVHEVVTLASIIEKETGVSSERPLISSVFHNRLRKHMRLETDPAVIYGIKNFDGNLTRRHLQTMTPYNTYKISGLPPGPIANPGRASLKAALFPADSKFLYFVSKQDSTHQFSTNYRDHIRAVRKYQLRR